MNATSYIREEMAKAAGLIERMLADEALVATVARVADRCAVAVRAGGKVMFCGNGGSAGDCQHLAAEMVGKLVFDRPSMAGLALTTDTSALTAIGNDFGYEHVFFAAGPGTRPGRRRADRHLDLGPIERT